MGGYWICDQCNSLNDQNNGRCYKCHVKRGEAKPQPVIPGAKVPPAASRELGQPPATAVREPNLTLAVLIGAAAAVFFTAGWYWFEAGIKFGQGRAAWLVGLLIAATVVVAGTVGGRRRVSFMLPVISVALTTAAVTAGEYLIISHALAAADVVGLPASTIRLASIDSVTKVALAYLSTDPLRPLLWALAVAAAWLLPWGLLAGSDDA